MDQLECQAKNDTAACKQRQRSPLETNNIIKRNASGIVNANIKT